MSIIVAKIHLSVLLKTTYRMSLSVECWHPKVADSMAISRLSFRNTLVGSGWATAVHGTLFRRESFIQVCTSGCRLKAVVLQATVPQCVSKLLSDWLG